MKKIVYIVLLCFSVLNFAQTGSNLFEESEETSSGPEFDEPQTAVSTTTNPGDPADPMPIDDYIPFLALTAMGIIVWTTFSKKSSV